MPAVAQASEQLGGAAPLPELYLEARLSASQISPAVYQQLELLEPYGSGNARPVFYSQRLQVRDARKVGSGHLKLWLADESGMSSAIGFGMATAEYGFARSGAVVDCAYTISRNERGGMGIE